MEIIFSKYYVIDNLPLLWTYVMLMMIIMIITIFLVYKEIKK